MGQRALYLQRQPPHGSSYPSESLEVALIAAAFDQDTSLAFIDDGVYQLLRAQDSDAIGRKNFSKTFGALGDYGITRLYIERESLQKRGLTEDDLMPIYWFDEEDNDTEKSALQIISQVQMADVIDRQDIVLIF